MPATRPVSMPADAAAPEAAARQLGFDALRPGQADVIRTLMDGENVLAVMPTGAGKSLCYQLPALLRPGLGIIVSPLIALMENQVQGLRARGIHAGMIHSGRDRAANVADWQGVTRGEIRLLYMSPERLMTPRMLAALARLPLSLIAIDEAHCVSQWGHHFRQEYRELARLRTLFPQTPIAAFTATADPDTRADILHTLFAGKARVHVQGFERPNLRLDVVERLSGEGQLSGLMRRHRGEAGIIYCRSRKGASETAARLAAQGLPAYAYHAGLDDAARREALAAFLSGRGVVICATVAFGMGVDRADVRFVIHRDLPASLEAYYQEIGRAGRDGAPARATLIFGLADLIVRRKMIDAADAPEALKRHERRRLDDVGAFAESRNCRWMTLRRHFGETVSRPCGRCDACKG